MTDRDTMRWVGRGSALTVLVIGWVFIAWQNHFHITAPLVFVCLGFLAVVATVYNLWRTGAAAVSSSEDEGDSTWAKPAGARGELEREKRTLLKAIKEAEFDHQMGKLSQRDVDDMVRTYRARAVEVYKEIDRLDSGAAGSPREQIMREVRARLEIEAKSKKKPAADAKQATKTDDAKARKPQPLAKAAATPAEPAASPADAAAEPATDAAEPASTAEAPGVGDAADVAKPTGDAVAHVDRAAVKAAVQVTLDDEALDADSTTTVEPKRDDPAKEATP
jgi:hypothetical protein